jgi:hypothetical protein
VCRTRDKRTIDRLSLLTLYYQLVEQFVRNVCTSSLSFWTSPNEKQVKSQFRDSPSEDFTINGKHLSSAIKPEAENSEKVPLSVPDNSLAGVLDGVWTLQRKDILAVFSPVLDACVDYLRGQIQFLKAQLKQRGVRQSIPQLAFKLTMNRIYLSKPYL